jgi:Methane oxygenase PmoA
MYRRLPFRLSAFLLLVSPLCGLLHAQPAKRPNILFIFADDQCEKAKDELLRTDAKFVSTMPKTKSELSGGQEKTTATSEMKGDYSIAKSGDKLIVTQGQATIAEYVLHDSETNKTYLWPVYGPQGTPMTRSFPMKDVQGEKQDHYHHRGIWFGHEDIGGVDTWAEASTFTKEKKPSPAAEARLAHIGQEKLSKLTSMEANKDRAVVTADIDYVGATGKKVLSEVRKITFSASGRFRLIDVDQELIASEGDVTLGDKKDAGLSIRVPHSMAVDTKQGGAIKTSEGLRDEAAWGKRARWVDYSGKNPDAKMGVVMLNHPGSFRSPTTWHVRTYGLFTANAFGTLDPASPNGPHTLKQGEKISLKHRFVLYDGEISDAEIEAIYQDYATGK